MSVSSQGGWISPNHRTSGSLSYFRKFSWNRNTSDIPGMPMLGDVIDVDGDVKHIENWDDAFFDFKSALSNSDVMSLIETIREDDAEKFAAINFKRIENISMSVNLTDLPARKYIAKSFWKTLTYIGLVHIVCLLSAHSILDILLRRKMSMSMTEESVTPVHICAALGDYIGLKMLLKADIPHLTKDRLGRLPLHYAVQTNLPTVIILLSIETNQLNMPDFENRLPLMFCQYYHYQTIRDYIIKLTEGINLQTLGNTREYEQNNGIHYTIVRDAHWKLPLHFESYLCTKRRPMYCFNGLEYCECSEDCVDHEKFSDNDDLNAVIASRVQTYIKRPTNTFGQFETPSSNVMAEFVRMTDDTSMDKLQVLFFEIWKLKQPELVLTLYGSVPPLKSLQKRFYNMVINVVQKTLTWVITDGVFDSVAEVISNGMRGYAEAHGLTKLQVIGVTPWRHLSFQSRLHSSSYMGRYQVSFPDKEKASSLQKQIAPFHTRYFFIDSGGKEDISCVQQFRSQFETWLANISLEVESFELSQSLPICGILVAGRPEHALGVYQALSRNIPFVVIGDSGGLASVLEQCINERKYLPDRRATCFNDMLVDAETAENENTERILDIMLHFWTEDEITPELLDLIIRTLSYSDLIEFFSYENDSDGTLDAKIVSSLINPALFQSQDSIGNWKPRLKIALELDRTDFVMEKILNDSHWTSKEMTPFVKSCLLKDKVHFLRIFADVGFNMNEFATTQDIEELYTIEAHRHTTGAAMLNEFLMNHQSKLPTRITIERVKKTLQNLMGHHFLTDNTQSLKRHNIAHRPTFKDIHDYLEEGSRKSRDVFLESGKDNCMQYLYLWALITRRFEIAQFLLMMQIDVSAGALFAAAFLRRLSKIARQNSDCEVYRLRAREFELLAVSVLNACYFNNKENTMHLLVMERRSYGLLSCMMIASEGNCREFMQHRACQEYLDRVWAHTLQIRNFSPRFYISLLIGTICPPLVPLIAEYDESKYFKHTDRIEMKRRFTVQSYTQKLKDFYLAPCVRHAYQLVTMLVLFTLFVVNLEVEVNFEHPLMCFISSFLIFLAIVHSFEFLRIAIMNWVSFRKFVSEQFNKLVIIACSGYIIGTIMQLLMYLVVPRTYLLEQFSQILLVMAIFFPFAKLLRLISIGTYIGPKLQMIMKMAKHDLLPYSMIIFSFWMMYCVVFSAIISRPHNLDDLDETLEAITSLMKSCFFQMFGEFQFEDFLEYFEKDICEDITKPGCTYPSYYIAIPLLMGMYTMITHVLLVNLLIAIFTKTYDEMQKISQQLWTMQRYRIMEYILAESVLPGPFLILSFTYQLIVFIVNPEVHKTSQSQRPFRKSFEDNPGRERQLINWEKLIALTMMEMHDDENDLERPSESHADHAKRRDEIWKRNSERPWQTVRKLMAPTMIFQNLAKSSGTMDGLEKQVRNIDAKLEKLTHMMSERGGNFVSRSPFVPHRKASLVPSRVESNVSSLSMKESDDSPIVLQWLNHQIAIFPSMTNETTPHSIDPPIPWEIPYPNYHAIPWAPRKFMVVHWRKPEEFSDGTSVHKTSVDSTHLNTYETAPKNPEGRVGTAGKGLLPETGENPACIFVVTRGATNEEILVLKGVQYHAQLPWFLCHHPHNCTQTTCFKGLIKQFCLSRVKSGNEAIDKAVVDDFVAYFNKYKKIGAISDPINCDNAWISCTAIHIKIPLAYNLVEEIEKMLMINECESSWVRRDELPELRKSHRAAMEAVI